MSLPQTVNTISNLLRVDINEIPYDQITPNSLLVIRGSAKDMPDMVELHKSLKDRLDPSVMVLTTNRDTDVLCIPEEVLNEAGWYKKI